MSGQIINNFYNGIEHPDSDLNKKLMNYEFAKDGNFFLKIEIINLEATHELVGDTAAGLCAIASVVGHLLKQTNNPKIALKMFNNIVEKKMESD